MTCLLSPALPPKVAGGVTKSRGGSDTAAAPAGVTVSCEPLALAGRIDTGAVTLRCFGPVEACVDVSMGVGPAEAGAPQKSHMSLKGKESQRHAAMGNGRSAICKRQSSKQSATHLNATV